MKPLIANIFLERLICFLTPSDSSFAKLAADLSNLILPGAYLQADRGASALHVRRGPCSRANPDDADTHDDEHDGDDGNGRNGHHDPSDDHYDEGSEKVSGTDGV